ncbi:YncE family protein [Nitrospira sp. BLG_1]|uniref:YncE family protein n=1 Tax=Nitrospira sp. BLG_1 TaxID=3395883 RepID=UPI0039BC4F59
MKTRHLLVAALSMLVGWGSAGAVQAAPTVSFEAGDRPGNFFTCSNTGNSTSIGCVPGSIGGAQQRSLAVIAPHETVGFPSFSGEASTIHTALSLLWPTGATHDDNLPFATHPFKAAIDFLNPAPGGVATVQLHKPGLYVFICDIHVYMFAIVIVDDPATVVDDPSNLVPSLGLDLGETITLVNGIEIPTASDLALRLVKTAFMITDPNNWKDYSKSSWQPSYPPVPVIAYAARPDPQSPPPMVPVANLNTLLQTAAVNPAAQLHNPTIPAIGEIWVNTQFELTAGKSKPGAATAVNGADWKLTKKVALPATNMNHPHNMWTDRDQNVIYQTQWFDERLAVFDRKTGEFIRELNAGPAPSHVMTRANNDLVHVAQNGGNNVREFNDLAGSGGASPNQFLRDIPMTNSPVDNSDIIHATHPHGHWMSSTGNEMVTPNENVNTSTVYNFQAGAIEATIPTGAVPIATGMMPDSSKYYVANFLDSTISVMNMANNSNTEIKKINLIEKYDPVGGCPGDLLYQAPGIPGKDCSLVGALPIQTPVSPDGTNMVTANTLTGTITVVDTRHLLPNGSVNPKEDTIVAMPVDKNGMACDPGCHGVQYGAKALPPGDKNPYGQYYAYVANKFSNAMIIVDPDPDRNGDPSDAKIVGRVLLAGSASTVQDDTVIGNKGMGGQGVLAVPNVYNGWVQQWVENCKGRDCNNWKKQLTSKQKNPRPVQ